MERNLPGTSRLLVFAIAGALASGPVFADKPSWAGNGKGEHRARDEGRDRDKGERREHFGDRHRVVVRDYFAGEFRTGKCPPGLAKKHNGCMPPGQAKRWEMGRPLPPGIVTYDLPPQLVVQIGVPPAGYRYVRVASDILMIAVGTNMVVDAINDLGRK